MKTEVTIRTLDWDGRKKVVKGEKVGPFVVHRMSNIVRMDWSHPKWGVTHAQTGFSAAAGPTKRCCMHAARRLRDIGMDWDFTDPATCLKWPSQHMKKIRVIRDACEKGEVA